jgi:hypothetical protein
MTMRGSTSHSFSRKGTSGQVTEEKVTPLMLFYGKILHYRAYSLIEIEGVRITLDLTKFCVMTDHSHISNRIARAGMNGLVTGMNVLLTRRNKL